MLRPLYDQLIAVYVSKKIAQEQFERLCEHLIRTEFSEAYPVRADEGKGDEGVDIYVGDWSDPTGIYVFQAKFVEEIGGYQKKEIKSSFKRALTSRKFKLKHWTLCLPISLSPEEIEWWEAWKEEQSRIFGIDIDQWLDTDLQQCLFKPENNGLRDAILESHSPLQDRSIQLLENPIKTITKKEIRRKQLLVISGILLIVIISILIRLLTGFWFPLQIFLKHPMFSILLSIFIALLCLFINYIWRWLGLLIGEQKHEWYLGKKSFARSIGDGNYLLYAKTAPCIFPGCFKGTVYADRYSLNKKRQTENQEHSQIIDCGACDADPEHHKYWLDKNDRGYPIPINR